MAKVLVVDDEMDIRMLHRMMLETAGHTVIEAHHGGAGLEAAKASQPDIVVTDLMMPVMTGNELITALREIPQLSTVPVLLISSSPGEPYKAGATMVFRKPVNMAELLQAVKDLTSTRQDVT